jgi:murein DD-endopeptidase MepM/ murein hydrolase activator NlpD
MPLEDVVTSRYGWRKGRMHYGIDINCNVGDTIYAAFSGRIRYSKFNDGGYGNLVVIRHYNGLETYYAHLSKLFVAPNELVVAGQPIGLGGNTGRSYGAHLHFEVRFYDLPINPEFLIDFELGELLDDNVFIHKGLFTPVGQSTPPVASSTTGAVTTTRTPSAAKYHKVKRGETLSSIARKHRTTVAKLCKLNKIKASSIIREGQTLRVK